MRREQRRASRRASAGPAMNVHSPRPTLLDPPSDSRKTRVLPVDPNRVLHVGGYLYAYTLPSSWYSSETAAGEMTGALLEDGLILGPPTANQALVEKAGGGYYSLWSD